jgi:hypothetical protein
VGTTERAGALSTFEPSCSVEVMTSHRSAVIASDDVEMLFEGILRGERGQKLRTQLASLHPESSREQIEEALQAACKQFVDKAEGISAPGQVYTWLRTTAHRLLSREAGYEGHELPADPTAGALLTLVDERPGPDEPDQVPRRPF